MKSSYLYFLTQQPHLLLHLAGKFLGAGGMNLKRLTADTGVQFSSKSEGVWQVFAPNREAWDEADEIIQKLLSEERLPDFEMGAIYEVKILEVLPRGIIVELHPDMEGIMIRNTHLSATKVSWRCIFIFCNFIF